MRRTRAPRRTGRRGRADLRGAGSLTLEVAAVLPLVALVLAGMLQVVAVARDALVVQEAARAGARAVAGVGRPEVAVTAARRTAGGRRIDVVVRPPAPRPGDVFAVRVTTAVRLGPLRPTVAGEAVAVLEPRPTPDR